MNEYAGVPICGNCKHFKQYGVMGFNGYSERCFNSESPYCEIDVSFDCTCEVFQWEEKK